MREKPKISTKKKKKKEVNLEGIGVSRYINVFIYNVLDTWNSACIENP